MPSQEKVEQVARLKGRISGSQALLLAEYRGLSVKDATELRRALGEDTRFSVVKNTLMRRAAGEAGVGELERLLEGPTAVAFVAGDPVAAAKRVVEAGKRFPALALKGAFMEGRVLDADEARGLAELESRDIMLSRLAGAFKAEMSRAAGMFQALQARFLALLEAYKEKVAPGEESAAEPQVGQAVKEEADVPATQAEGAEPPEAKASEEGEE
ncbi:MAG TPA: 50S ribosomal protein L10 [Actinomycetota bacterium]|nr:50S ribosomal protein L10 [Actinomycetota bacterium]